MINRVTCKSSNPWFSVIVLEGTCRLANCSLALSHGTGLKQTKQWWNNYKQITQEAWLVVARIWFQASTLRQSPPRLPWTWHELHKATMIAYSLNWALLPHPVTVLQWAEVVLTPCSRSFGRATTQLIRVTSSHRDTVLPETAYSPKMSRMKWLRLSVQSDVLQRGDDSTFQSSPCSFSSVVVRTLTRLMAII